MTPVLIVAEKPSAARNMAQALGGMSGTYSGTDYKIVALRGHLYEYCEPHEQVDPALAAKYKSWEVKNLPWDLGDIAWKRKPQQGVGDILRTLKAEAGLVHEICCATDVDPTGEGGLLFAEPIEELGIRPGKLTRMYFTDEAPASIQKAFVARKEIVGGLAGFDEYRKATTRARFDWLTLQFTRVATSSAAQRAVLRQGRLKSAMLLLVGEQLKAYNDWVKKPFFENRFRDENEVMYSDPDEPRFPDQSQVPHMYRPSDVVVDSKSDKRVSPPRLLDLAALGARLSTKGVRADTLLATYQRMYEDQVVSYPRTEDKTITGEQFKELLPLVNKIAGVVGVDVTLLTHRSPRSTHVKDQGAHGANRPGPKVPASLTEVQAKYGPTGKLIYEELGRSFLAMLAEDYVYESQLGHVKDFPTFKGSAAVPKVLGWKQVFSEEADPNADPESASGLGTHAEPFIYEGMNKRPEQPSMKWLMKQLEKRDVGTGATRTSTYAEVTKAPSAHNKYPLMAENRGKLTLTEFGEMGYRMLPGTRIGDLGVTEHVYREMREVAAGTKSVDDVIGVVASWVAQDIQTMAANAADMRKELGLTAQAAQKDKFKGPWAARGGEEISFNREWSGHVFTDDECEALLAGKVIEFTAVSARTKASFDAKGQLGEQVFERDGNSFPFIGFKPDFGPKLDATGQEMPPKTWCKHSFTADELTKLAAGAKVYVEGFTSSKGKTFAATVHFGTEAGRPGKRIIPEFG